MGNIVDAAARGYYEAAVLSRLDELSRKRTRTEAEVLAEACVERDALRSLNNAMVAELQAEAEGRLTKRRFSDPANRAERRAAIAEYIEQHLPAMQRKLTSI